MPENRTDKSKYPSIYSNGWISAPQYVAEVLYSNIAEQSGKEFSKQFWSKDEKLRKEFAGQVVAANKLLKKYPIKIILAALRSPEGKRIFSLRMKTIGKLLEKFRKEEEKCQVQTESNVDVNEKPKVFQTKKTLLSKLD